MEIFSSLSPDSDSPAWEKLLALLLAAGIVLLIAKAKRSKAQRKLKMLEGKNKQLN